MMKPIAQRMTPAMSQPVPNLGWLNFVTLGEFNSVTGKETVQTQNIWLPFVRDHIFLTPPFSMD